MSWKVLNMKRRSSDGYILEVSSAYEKEDVPGYARKKLNNTFTGTPGDGFTPYEDLTEAIVLGWVKDSLGAEEVSSIETSIDAEAAAKKQAIENPVNADGLPWSNENDPAASSGGLMPS